MITFILYICTYRVYDMLRICMRYIHMYILFFTVDLHVHINIFMNRDNICMHLHTYLQFVFNNSGPFRSRIIHEKGEASTWKGFSRIALRVTDIYVITLER